MTNVRGEQAKRVWTIAIILIFAISVIATFFMISRVRASSLPENDNQALVYVNDERVSNGLNPLNWSDELALVASDKANDIIDRDYFNHASPSGDMIWSDIEDHGYNYLVAGENLAIDFEDLKSAQNGWINSPSHYKNIVSSKYTDFGFAQVSGDFNGKQTNVFVQIFASKNNLYERILTSLEEEHD